MIVWELGKMAAKELPKVYSKGASKTKNRRLKNRGNSNFANILVDSGASYIHDKL